MAQQKQKARPSKATKRNAFLARMKKGREAAAKRRAGSCTGNRAATRRVTSRRKKSPGRSRKNVTRLAKNTPARSRNAIRQVGTDRSGRPVYAATVTTKGVKQTLVHGNKKALERLVKNPAGRTSTSSDVRSPTRTATSTEALTSGNSTVTVTGGAGRGATTRVDIHATPKAGRAAVGQVPRGTANPLRFKSEADYRSWASRAGKPKAKKRTAKKSGGAFGRKRGVKKFKRVGLFGGSGLFGLGRSVRRISRNGDRKANAIYSSQRYPAKKSQRISHSRIKVTRANPGYQAWLWDTKNKFWRGPFSTNARSQAEAKKKIQAQYGHSGKATVKKNPSARSRNALYSNQRYPMKKSQRISSSRIKVTRANPSYQVWLWDAANRFWRGPYTTSATSQAEAKAKIQRQYGHSGRATVKKNPQRRRNETPQGVQAIHKTFLGRPSHKAFLVAAPKGTPADVAVLGGLVELKTQTETFGFAPGEAHLGADPDGRMFVLGNVRAEPHHDFGELIELSYTARKAQIDDKFIEYFHKFREDGGIPPKLTTDAEGAFHILGGSYTIEAAGITR